LLENRLEKLRAVVSERGIESIFVTDLLNVRYVTGFTGSFGFAIITANLGVFLNNSPYTHQSVEQTEHRHIEIMRDGWIATICRIVEQLKIRQLGFEEHDLSFENWSKLHALLPNVEMIPIGNPIGIQRMVKDQNEINLIREAAKLADAGFSHILSFIKPGISECELGIELDFSMRKCGAEKEAFEAVIASGPRSALVHGRATNRPISEGEFVLLDFGARYAGYHSDITRTIMLGKPDAKQLEIYNTVLEAQSRAIEAIKPGVTGGAIDEIARDCIIKSGYGDCFGHGLGHGLGLHIHDDRVLSKGSEIVLEQGMIFTVEPGIYITDWGGVRIEDDILVTDSGFEVLTHSSKKLNVYD
jgi:Xaa-Pro aminopeptidase